MTFVELLDFAVGFYLGYKFGVPVVKFIKDLFKEIL